MQISLYPHFQIFPYATSDFTSTQRQHMPYNSPVSELEMIEILEQTGNKYCDLDPVSTKPLKQLSSFFHYYKKKAINIYFLEHFPTLSKVPS